MYAVYCFESLWAIEVEGIEISSFGAIFVGWSSDRSECEHHGFEILLWQPSVACPTRQRKVDTWEGAFVPVCDDVGGPTAIRV